jgi:penicillin amidase
VISRIAAVAAIVLAAIAVAALCWLAWPLPTRRGTAVIPGLSTPVDVRFDRRGVPHVRSVLESDAWRALGWLHASDRLFQMELRRRAAKGRLAEAFGSAALGLDRWARRLGYEAMARRDWEAAADEDRAVLRAYADGVNAFIEGHPLPLELKAVGVVPEPWTPQDALAFQRLMFEDLTIAASRESELFEEAKRRGPRTAAALYDASEGGTTTVAPEVAEFLENYEVGGSPSTVDSEDEGAPGSNAWALAGSRTASGRPVLAGDPHLNAERPGVWYAAHLTSADGLDVAGLTLAGAPGLLIGHNARVAWSITMQQADDGDLFLERVDTDAGTCLREGGWVPMTKATETIGVRGGEAVVEEVWRTPHGPIVERFDGAPGYALARRVASDGETQGIRPFLDAARARSGAELVAAFARYGGPAFNICWADTGGHIGLQAAGSVPARRSGDGRFPVPAWTGAYDWDGLIPRETLPSIRDPREGFVATANDDWSVAGAPLPYPGLYANRDRAGRARELAGGLRKATIADMRRMQADVYSPYAARLVRALGNTAMGDPRAARALAILKGWDARASVRGPSRLFYTFLGELRASLAASLATGGREARIGWSFLDRLIAGGAPASLWDDPRTAAVETRESRVQDALAAALTAVERADGVDPSVWRFGEIHRITYPHPFAQALPLPVARRLAFGPVALAGEWHTLAVAGFTLRSTRFDVRHIPSARLIVDLGDPDATRLVLPLGQSGQLFDRHAHDQLGAWSRGNDFALPFTSEAIAEATVSTMRFLPPD